MEAAVGAPRARPPSTNVPVGHAASPLDSSSAPLPESEWMLSQVRETPASPFSVNRSNEAGSGCTSLESATQTLNICCVLDVDMGHASPFSINSMSRDKRIMQRPVQPVWLDGNELGLHRKHPASCDSSSATVSSMFGERERMYQPADYLSTPLQPPPSLATAWR